MKIGLIDIEPKIFNTAYMQIAYHHRQQGDTVEWAAPLEYGKYDKLYCSSLFDFTDKSQVPDRTICGGTGFDLTTDLSFDCDLDYSIYPKCKTTYLWFSRGCVRNCPWCIVRQKEGKIRPVIPKNLNPQGKYITVQDNNFFESGNWWPAIQQLRYYDQPVDFQGIDVRTITKGQCKALDALKHYKQIKIAWDDPHEDLTPYLREITRYIKPRKIMCYVLIGFYDEPARLARGFDLYRIMTLSKYGITPFVMRYNMQDLYQKLLARWVDKVWIFKSCTWKEFQVGELGKAVFS